MTFLCHNKKQTHSVPAKVPIFPIYSLDQFTKLLIFIPEKDTPDPIRYQKLSNIRRYSTRLGDRLGADINHSIHHSCSS